jgi:hypothetical protein
MRNLGFREIGGAMGARPGVHDASVKASKY